jgi:GNAT superfamily N-acetyltransferase
MNTKPQGTRLKFVRVSHFQAQSDRAKISALVATCNDSLFAERERCSMAYVNRPEEDPDVYFIAMDTQRKIIVGVLTFKYATANRRIDAAWLAYLTTTALKNPKEYKGLGKRLMDAARRFFLKDKRIKFLYLTAYEPGAMPFYLKAGFVILANTRILAMPLRTLPTINRARSIEIGSDIDPRATPFRSLKSDMSLKRLRATYCAIPVSQPAAALSTPQNTFIYPERALSQVQPYAKYRK